MSTRSILLSVLLFTGVTAYADTNTIELDAGTLRTQNGTTIVPLNGLLQIIYNPTSTSAAFTAPTPGAFTTTTGSLISGTDRLAVNLALNSATGETDNVFSITVNSDSTLNSATSLDVGEPLLLRWFPGFTLVGTTITRNPAIGGVGSNNLQAGDQYGEFRSTMGQLGGIAWVAQTGGSYNLNFLTSDLVAGGYAPMIGFANFTVVPEPSTYAFLSLGLLGGLAWMRRSSGARRNV